MVDWEKIEQLLAPSATGYSMLIVYGVVLGTLDRGHYLTRNEMFTMIALGVFLYLCVGPIYNVVDNLQANETKVIDGDE